VERPPKHATPKLRHALARIATGLAFDAASPRAQRCARTECNKGAHAVRPARRTPVASAASGEFCAAFAATSPISLPRGCSTVTLAGGRRRTRLRCTHSSSDFAIATTVAPVTSKWPETVLGLHFCFETSAKPPYTPQPPAVAPPNRWLGRVRCTVRRWCGALILSHLAALCTVTASSTGAGVPRTSRGTSRHPPTARVLARAEGQRPNLGAASATGISLAEVTAVARCAVLPAIGFTVRRGDVRLITLCRPGTYPGNSKPH